MPEWSSWSGRIRCQPESLAAPSSEAEVADLVRAAARAGKVVRVAGSGHSFTPIVATDGVLLSLDRLSGIESFDPDRLEATIRAGSIIRDLGEPLRELGGALANQGDVDVQAFAGAVATGTHGTGPTLGSLSTRVTGVRFVDASGRVVTWDESTPGAHMDAARVSLGALGVMTALRVALVPPYRLHERTWHTPLEQCIAELDERIAATRHFEFFWWPHSDEAEMKTLDPTEAEPGDVGEGAQERIDWSSRIFPSVRDLRFNEMEYAVAAEDGLECLRAVRERMLKQHPDVLWPIEYRTLGADRVWLSPAYERASVTISIHQDARVPSDAFFADIESIFREHRGRPHWAKVHTRSAAELRALYPRMDDFLALRRALDPGGVFLSPYLAEIFGIGTGGDPVSA